MRPRFPLFRLALDPQAEGCSQAGRSGNVDWPEQPIAELARVADVIVPAGMLLRTTSLPFR